MTATKKKAPRAKKPKGLPANFSIKKLRLANLTGAAYNPRAITDEAFRGLRESIRTFGMLEMPIVNAVDGEFRLVSGHQRVQAMLAEGIDFADCVVVRLTDAQERAANLTMNNPSIRGTFDVTKAAPSIPDLSANLPRPDFLAMDKLIADLQQKVSKATAEAEGAKAKESEPSKRQGKPKSKKGTVYQLGKHRVYCGDFVKGLALLCSKQKPKACITDPPYNADYESRAGEKIENDNLHGEEWHAFLSRFASATLKMVSGPVFVFMTSKELPALERAWRESKGAVARWLFWVKDSFTFTLSRRDYQHQHEPILFGHRAGVSVKVDPGLTNVLEFPRPKNNDLHPTQKPVGIVKALMEKCSEPGDIVLDPFLGSGTTLAVAEETGRICIGCECDERFVDATRKRWAEQTNGPGCDWAKLTPAV